MCKENNLEQYKEELFKQGYFICLHGLIVMLQDGHLTKAGYLVLHELLHRENRRTTQPNQWLEYPDRELSKSKLFSRDVLKSGRINLKELGLIDFKIGKGSKNTTYRILIPGKYYYKKFIDFGKNKDQKAK
ncbi:MAG: hypothetical protein HQ547_05605 [Candidatus Omnitrophica bacterium]|nr:hypothetical protein [Candidatus Omnitrophota bacterium]